MNICYLGIGSNLGDRKKNIDLAIENIKKIKNTYFLKMAPIIETEPEGGPKGQGKYLNTVIKIKTSLNPSALLRELKNIEKKLGRTKTVRNGPRVIDLDILLYADKIISTKKLKIPHPRLFLREFVLEPLSKVI
jgi:dihydroneopterin aldolase/2-amino-4-hydroxy-6-hydroxymethyldihydropteridine diphosphokinase